jgi:DNA-binding XRE family transcriptional regulator
VAPPRPRQQADDSLAERIAGVGRAHPSTAVRRGNDALVYRDPFTRPFMPPVLLFLRGAGRARRSRMTSADDDAAAAFARVFGTQVRAARTAAGITQTQAERDAGLRPGMLARVERGQVDPTVWDAARVATALGVSLAELLTEPGA